MAATDQRRQVETVQADRVSLFGPQTAFRLLFELSPDAILLIDDGTVIDCNKAALEVFRYSSKNALLSTDLAEFSPPVQPDGLPSIEKSNSMISTAIEKGSHRFEWLGKRLDGTEFPVEVLLTAIPLKRRHILHAVWRDISRRKSAEAERSLANEALRNQSEILTSILHNMGDAVIVTDLEQKYLIFNPAAEHLFGTVATDTKAEGWSRTYDLYLSDQTTPFPREDLPLARAIRGEEVHDLEMFVRHENAPEGFWTRVSGTPLRDAANEISGGVIVCRDISERKKEDAFRAGQGRVLEMIARGESLEDVLANLVLLIEAQCDGMYCSVLQLSEDGKYIRSGAAPSLPEIYIKAVDGAPIGPRNGSCGTAMYLGKPVIVTDILDHPYWEDYYELAKLSGLRACWSTPIFSGTGKVLGSFAMYYRNPQAPNGTEARLTEVATHIAGIAIEHQRAEGELRRTQSDLAHVSRVTTMGELAASIAHEVNQPLGAIVGNADICLQWLEGDGLDLAQLREAIMDIANDGRRASAIIARIRSLVKKTPQHKALLDLSDVARDVLDLVGHEAQRKQVKLRYEFKMGLPLVNGDRVQMQQVLLNLVMNGIEAMTDLKDRIPELTLEIAASGTGGIITEVRDCGTGIKPDEIERVFRPFHTTKMTGLGMGLAISKSIVEDHGGRLWVEPTPPPGSVFKFTLPAYVK